MNKRRHGSGGRGGGALEVVAPLSLEKALVRADYALLSILKEKGKDELVAGLTYLEKAMDESGAVKDLDALCSANCDREDLLWLLHWFSNKPVFQVLEHWFYTPGTGTTEKLLGIKPRRLKKLLIQLNEVAAQVEQVNLNFEFGVLLSASELLNPLWHLPEMLRVYAGLLQYAARHFAGGSHIYHNVAKARLTTYVLNKTNDFHDKEVAALVSSVSRDKNCRYDATAQCVWRRKHYARLKTVDPVLLSHGPMTDPDSRPIPTSA